MPRSVEARRLAIVEALRDLAREGSRGAERARRLTHEARAGRLARVEHDVNAVERRVAAIDERLADVVARLASVETTLLESAWQQPQQPGDIDTQTDTDSDADTDSDEAPRTVVPPVADATTARMSPAASRALFGD